jgi:phosphoglycolate phosphatase
MGIRAIVFDFDGTLIDSNRLKYNAYFDLFPPDAHHRQVIRAVLSEIFEKSRYVILEAILRRLGAGDESALKRKAGELAQHYNKIVLAGAKTCAEITGAEQALRRFAPTHGMYVISTTPDEALNEIIRSRKWDGYFLGVFGYPHKKPETLRRIMALENMRSDQVLVVGDGESDRESAMENGCPFVHVTEEFRFEELGRIIAGS